MVMRMDGPQLLAHLRQLLPEATEMCALDASGSIAQSGAYLLLITLGEPVPFARAALGRHMLSGHLVYVGSARGAGGITARVARHLRRGKSVRWHVDELTNAAQMITALAVADGDECAIVAQLLKSRLFVPALKGFGSSDCRVCPAHLLKAAR